MKPEDEERMLTRSEAAQHFGLSQRYLEVAASKGRGPPLVKIGRMVRYRIPDVRCWIESKIIRGEQP